MSFLCARRRAPRTAVVSARSVRGAPAAMADVPVLVEAGSHTWRVTNWSSKANGSGRVTSDVFEMCRKRWCAPRSDACAARARAC
jgi:hypothetical protein